MDGSAQNEGRVEVNYKGAFGSVCEDNFGTPEAATVCHQLGFAGVSRVATCCQFGQTSGETWLDNVDCGTGEVWLANCTHRGWGVEDCHHGQDVGVECNGALNIRLAGGSTGFEGRVEQYFAGSWDIVCDGGWDLNDAKVVCRQLGLGGAVRATTGSFFGQGTGRAIFFNVDCTGNETALGWCLHSGWNSGNCSQAAGVMCEGPRPNVRLAGTTDSSIVVTCSVVPQLQFTNILTEWKVTLQREGDTGTFVTSLFTAPNKQITINHLLTATRYSVWVSVKAGNAEGPLSNSLQVTTLEGVPGPVASISGFSITARSVELTWTPPLATNGVLTAYHIEYQSATGSGISDNGEEDLPVSATSYTVTGLEENTLYHLTVSAETSAGRGEGSTVSVRTAIDRPSSPPRNVSVEEKGPNSVEVTWQAPQLVHHNGPILSYIIRYFPSNESDMTQDSHVTADDETIQHKSLTNLEPFTRYSFRVSAVNGAGAGPFSVAVEGITEEHVPSIVESLTGNGFPTSIQLSWAPPSERNGIITGYFLAYGTGSGEFSSEDIPASITTYNVTGLEENTLYQLTVSAETSAGRGEGSTVSLWTLPDVPDGAPRELTANSTGPTKVALSWQAPLTEEHNGRLLSYKLEYSISGSSDAAQEISVPVDSSGGGNQERVVEGLQPYTAYQFRVRAVNEVGEGPFSNPVVIITPEDVPGAVESFTATTVSSSAIHLSWTPPHSPNGRIIAYKLKYSAILLSGTVNNGNEFISPSSVGGVLIISDLEEDALYQFTLQAETSAGEGKGKTTSAKTEEDMPSAAPQHISVSASSPRSAVVRWRGPPLDDQNGRIVHYVVRYFPADDRSLVREEEVEAPESQYDVIEHVVDQLQPYTTYKFVVAAATAAGQGPFSNPSSIRMPQDIPSKVRELTVSKATASSLAYTLIWEPPASPNGIIRIYKVYSNNSEVATVYSQTSFTFAQLTPDTLYLISVGAFTDAGEGERGKRMIWTGSPTEPPTEFSPGSTSATAESIEEPYENTMMIVLTVCGSIVVLATVITLAIAVLVCKKLGVCGKRRHREPTISYVVNDENVFLDQVPDGQLEGYLNEKYF